MRNKERTNKKPTKERINKKPSAELLEIIERANLSLSGKPLKISSWQQSMDDILYQRFLLEALVEISELYQSTLIGKEKLKDFMNEASGGNFELLDFEFPRLAFDSNLNIVRPKELIKRFLDAARYFLNITFDESHQIQIGWTGLAENLLGYDIRRFRKCPICKKFFWADRIDKKCCSRECSNVFNQRVFQSDPNKRDEYNTKRREAYKSKQELKRGKIRRKKKWHFINVQIQSFGG